MKKKEGEAEEIAKKRWQRKDIQKGGWGKGEKGKNNFVQWYKEKFETQNGKCFYCGLDGKVVINYEKQLGVINMLKDAGFRKGKRGKSLEIDRKEPMKPYASDNCELACYPCNNAKSDVFNWEEFIIIGAVIGALKQENKLKKLKNNKFIQGLINDVIKRKKNRSSEL
jgi:5-methylcytosine-specific restriction endonuclease McrA